MESIALICRSLDDNDFIYKLSFKKNEPQKRD